MEKDDENNFLTKSVSKKEVTSRNVVSDRVYKTPVYTRNASIAYNKRHPERVKACNERNNERKRQIRLQEKAKHAEEKAKLAAAQVISPAEKIKKFFSVKK